MTAFLDRISQLLTTSPLWIQSPIVILGSVVVCALLAVLLLRVVDILGAWEQIPVCVAYEIDGKRVDEMPVTQTASAAASAAAKSYARWSVRE